MEKSETHKPAVSPERAALRKDFADLLLMECKYWRDVDDERLVDISIGAMGALANVLAAVVSGKTPEQYLAQIKARDESTARESRAW